MAVSLSTSTSNEARAVELAWMQGVCSSLTVAAKVVAASAATVAKVKPFIVDVECGDVEGWWCCVVVVPK